MSIKNIWRSGRLNSLEIRVLAHRRHGRQDLDEAATPGPRQRFRKNRSMLGFGAAAVRSGALLQRPNDVFIDPAYEKIGHDRFL
ncbi:MAG: hypothetical protein JO288_18200 [Hyphomicrobiales bacterium]|nr:hypothetical protein [Hyphomicrobiales bacterium]